MRRMLALVLPLLALPAVCPAGGILPGDEVPAYLADRGTGTPSSMFGTYIRGGELLIYPYFEYYYDQDAEYKPAEFGYELEQDFRGEFVGSEYLLFLGYGVTDNLALEIEAAYMDATLKRSADDTSEMPDELSESGLGDVESQIRWRWMTEGESRPELFSYFEVVFPFSEEHSLIGTSDWELILGTGVTRGFGWGTVTARVAAEYVTAETTLELGELAVEYLKRFSPSWRGYLAAEGAEDEWELITELQWHVTDFAFVKLNNAFGITSKATDWAPEVGVVFSLGPS